MTTTLLCTTSQVTPREGTRPTSTCRPGPLTRRRRLTSLCMSPRGNFPFQIMAWVAASFAGALAAGIAAQDPITELVADRTAVERVYYDHRLGAKPPFEEVLPVSEVARLVNADLHKEAVLVRVYQVEVTRPQIEAEVKRINLETRAPQMLAEIKTALGNDPARFARAVAKPIVVERELRRRFENDDRLHVAQRKQMETAREQILALQRNENSCAPVLNAIKESPHGLNTVHWDHEPAGEIQSAAGAAHSKTWRRFESLRPTRQRLGVRRPSAAFDASAHSKFVRFMGGTGGTVSEVSWQFGPRPVEARSLDPRTPVVPPLPVKARSSKYSLDATATFTQTSSPSEPPGEPADETWFEDLSPELRNVLSAQLQEPGDVSAVIETPNGFLLFVAKERTEQSLSAAALSVSKISFEQWLSEQKE